MMKHRRWLGCLLSIAISTTAFGADARLDELANSHYWHLLMHYRKSFPLRKLRSLVDGPEFFFAPDGKTNPRAELEATVAAFTRDDLKVGRLKQHPQCAYPERYRFLKKELGLNIKDVACPKVEEYLAKFNNPQSATLVFSSAYPNNPGSMFGHTFLRINSNANPKNDLLDYGISFAAVVPPEDGGIVFAALGLSGGYIGQFGLLPYYAKVNEYSNSESRDLWEYDLAINPEQTRRMLLHTWEIETNSWFDYYFFDENCALVLLQLLEIARPDWDVAEWGIYVIPGETVKRMAGVPGAVTGVKFRPSLRKRLYQRLGALSGEQKKAFFQVIERKTTPDTLGDTAVLESVASYLYYLKQRDDGKLAERDKAMLSATLVRRSELGTSTLPPLGQAREDSRPDLGHHTYRLGTSGGRAWVSGKGSEYFQELQWKFAFHDLLNNDTGYIKFSQIDFPGATLRFVPQSGKLRVEHFQGLAIASLFPMTFIEKRPSWRFNFDYYSPKDLGCVNCGLARAEGGAGATVELFTPDYIAYALLMADFQIGSALRKGFRFAPKLQLSTILNPVAPFKLLFATNLVADLFQDDRRSSFVQLEAATSYALSQAWELRAQSLWFNNYNEEKLTLNFYF